MRGRIKWYGQKGFGYITRDDNNSDLFFHISAVSDETYLPLPGDLVEFEIQQGRKGPEAARMRQIGPEKSEEPTEPPAPLAINDPSLTNVQADLENIKDPSARRRLASGFVYALAETQTDGPKP